MKKILPLLFAYTLVVTQSHIAAQGFFERFGFGGSKPAPAAAPLATVIGLSQDEMIGGLRLALAKGVEHAVGALGTNNGFLGDLAVKIPMPEELQQVEKTLRRLGRDRLADDFVTTLNRIHAVEPQKRLNPTTQPSI